MWTQRVGDYRSEIAKASSTEELKGILDRYALNFTPLPGVMSEKNILIDGAGWHSAEQMKNLIDSYESSGGTADTVFDSGMEGAVGKRLYELMHPAQTLEAPTPESAPQMSSAPEEGPVERDRKALDFETFMYRHGTYQMNAEQAQQLLSSRLANRLESVTKALVGNTYLFTELSDAEKKNLAQQVLGDPDFEREIRNGDISPEFKARLENLSAQRAA